MSQSQFSGNPPPRALPFRAGPYECYHYMGGNRSEVYLARDLRTGFTRAVKIVATGYAPESEFIERFLAEGAVARLCSLPNLVTTYEVDLADGIAYIAMEHLQGETLKVLLERGKLRTLAERINIAWQVAHALAYLHQQNIMHRELKPENIIVDPLGHVKVFNFGVARMSMPRQNTRDGQLIGGTPLYMSPEQVRGGTVTPATDIYSYGVVLFVLFTGAFPFRAVSREELYAAVVFYPPDLSPLEGKGIPVEIVELISRCLEKVPSARPGSFEEIERLLRPKPPWPEAEVGTVPPPFAFSAPAPAPVPLPVQQVSQKKISLRWMAWLFAVLVVLATAGAATFQFMHRGINRPPPSQAEPRIQTKTGFMVLVPAGPTLIGKDRHSAQAPAFYIDRTEASNEAYRAFARASGHALPPALSDDVVELPATFPVVNVSYDDATAFCQWAGKRLPTDIEWEKAARGADGLPYPWGDRPRPDFANLPFKTEPHEIQPVESNFAGASPYGAINLVGNVWEWVAKPEALEEKDMRWVVLDPPVAAGEPAYQIRGGSFLQHVELNEAVWDFAVAPARLMRPDIGFRCAIPYVGH